MRVKERQGEGGSQVLDGVGTRGRIKVSGLQPCLTGGLEKKQCRLA